MNLTKIAVRFFDECIMVDKIIWLAGNAENQCDDLEDLIENEDSDTLAELFALPKKTAESYMDLVDVEDLVSRLVRAGRMGFLVKAATPVPTHFHESGHTYSWGYSTTKWFYTEALDEAFAERLVQWKDAFIASKKAKQTMKKAGKVGTSRRPRVLNPSPDERAEFAAAAARKIAARCGPSNPQCLRNP